MNTTLKATYEQGVLRLKEPLSFNDGAPVDVIVISHEEEDGEGRSGMGNRSWEVLTRVLQESAIDTGVSDLAHQHDHYLYGIPKKMTDAESTG